jgi:hypothetical protein
LWFGLVPTYSSEHWTDPDGVLQPKLDDTEIYELRCIVTQPPEPGHEHCPPLRYISTPTAPFRLAPAFDPDGTKNRTVSIKTPDLRRLAARAGKKQGPGGVRISTPPNSGLSPVDFSKIPGANLGSPGGGSICTFAFELFFLVALFLFLLFLPIIVLAFQLWWLLALRFCFPPSISFGVVKNFFAAGGLMTNLEQATGSAPQATKDAFDDVMGLTDAAKKLRVNSSFPANAGGDVIDAMDPANAQLAPVPPDRYTTPPDPLCPHA